MNDQRERKPLNTLLIIIGLWLVIDGCAGLLGYGWRDGIYEKLTLLMVLVAFRWAK